MSAAPGVASAVMAVAASSSSSRPPMTMTSTTSSTLNTHNADGSTKRVWAACEACRKKRVRCDACMPCAGCITAEAVKAGLTYQQYLEQQQEAASRGGNSGKMVQQIFDAASRTCYFDWNRKKRGPRRRSEVGLVKGEEAGASSLPASASASKAQVVTSAATEGTEDKHRTADGAPKPKRRRKAKAVPNVGMPRTLQSAGQAYLQAQQAKDLSLRVHSTSKENGDDNKAHLSPTDSFASTSMAMYSSAATQSIPATAPLFGNFASPSNARPRAETHSGISGSSYNAPWSTTFGNPHQITPSEENIITPPDHQQLPGIMWNTEAKDPFSAPSPFTILPSIGSNSNANAGAPLYPPDMGFPRSFPGQDDSRSESASTRSSGAMPLAALFAAQQSGASDTSLATSVNSAAAGSGGGPSDLFPSAATSTTMSENRNGRIHLPPLHDPPPQSSALWHNNPAPPRKRPSHSRNLLAKLSTYYTEEDLPFIAIAIAQFGDLDAQNKLFASKFLFGEQATFEQDGGLASTPDHLQLALLSVLAHRSLLLPGGQSSRDLDVSAASPAASSAGSTPPLFSSLALGSAGSPRFLLGGQGLTGKLRESMLTFARRSYELAVTIWRARLREGSVDPLLIVTGWALDLAMSENGAGTLAMGASKATLFRILLIWNLHLMDAPPGTVGPDVPAELLPSKDLRIAPGNPQHLLTDPVERECVRRIVQTICASFIWTSTIDCSAPPVDMTCMQVSFAEDDDAIHADSAWRPERPSRRESLMRVTQYTYRLFLRVTRMLHTPLDDLVTGTGSEQSLQKDVSEIEDGLKWVKQRSPRLHIGDLDDTFRVQLFIDVRLVELITYRLFSAVSSYVQLCYGWDPNQNFIVGPTLLPAGEDELSSFNKLTGATHIGALGQKVDHTNRFDEGYRLHFTKDPKLACCSPLWEVEELANVIITMLHPSAPPSSPKESGTAAGVTMDRSVRAARLPRHFRMLAQHAFAMAAEVQAVGASWSELGGSPDPAWHSPSSSADIPEFNSEEFIGGLWRIGTTLITLLKALAETGSAHAKQTAAKLEEYKDQRVKWMMSQQYQ